MIAETMIKPSSWINQGIVLRQVENFNLFKFSDELNDRLDELNDRLKTLGLSESEQAEWKGLLELDQIFTLLNAKVGLHGCKADGIRLKTIHNFSKCTRSDSSPSPNC